MQETDLEVQDELENRLEARSQEMVSHVFADPSRVVEVAPPELKLPTKRQRKKPMEDIFNDFGKEHDFRAVEEVDVAGMTLHRFNLKRIWQSEDDLRRWQAGLTSNARHNKLLTDVRRRWHPDFRGEVADLAHNHNVVFRARNSLSNEQSNALDPQSNAEELRELQRLVKPPEKKKRHALKGTGIEALGSYFATVGKEEPTEKDDEQSSKDGSDYRPQLTEHEAIVYSFLDFLLWTFDSLEGAFRRMNVTRSGRMTFAEFATALRDHGYRKDPQAIWKKLGHTASGDITIKAFTDLRPDMLEGIVNRTLRPRSATPFSSCSRRSSSSGAPQNDVGPLTSADVASRLGQLATSSEGGGWEQIAKELVNQDAEVHGAPKTLSLLLFRNADRNHCGSTLFLRRPVASMKELLRACEKVCMPVVPPVEALLDCNLQPVRSMAVLRPQTMYLVKGQEVLDPNPHMFICESAAGPSLRNLCAVEESCRAQARYRLQAKPGSTRLPLQSKSMSESFLSTARASSRTEPAGSPPWVSHLPSIAQVQTGEKWKPKKAIAASLSWRGQGQAPMHRKYETWSRVALSSDRNMAKTC